MNLFLAPRLLSRFSVVIAGLAIIVALIFGLGVSQPARAAAVCSPAIPISVPFTRDGETDICYQASSLCASINSWNLSLLEINGVNYTNVWASGASIAPLNGVYTIHYVSLATFGHFEINGPCAATPTPTRTRTATYGPSLTPTRTPTITPTRTITPTVTATLPGGICSPVNAVITAPFNFDGAGTYCWQAASGSFINSFNTTILKVNGVNYTNIFAVTSSLPAKINGYWYISLYSAVPWAHFEWK